MCTSNSTALSFLIIVNCRNCLNQNFTNKVTNCDEPSIYLKYVKWQSKVETLAVTLDVELDRQIGNTGLMAISCFRAYIISML